MQFRTNNKLTWIVFFPGRCMSWVIRTQHHLPSKWHFLIVSFKILLPPLNRELKPRRRQLAISSVQNVLLTIVTLSRLFQLFHRVKYLRTIQKRNYIERRWIVETTKNLPAFFAEVLRKTFNHVISRCRRFWRGRQTNVPNCKTRVQSDCLSSLKPLVYGVVEVSQPLTGPGWWQEAVPFAESWTITWPVEAIMSRPHVSFRKTEQHARPPASDRCITPQRLSARSGVH